MPKAHVTSRVATALVAYMYVVRDEIEFGNWGTCLQHLYE